MLEVRPVEPYCLTRMMVRMGVGAEIGRGGVPNCWRKGVKLEVREQQGVVRQGEGRR